MSFVRPEAAAGLARWREALQPMIESYLGTVEAEGVDNAREIYQAMQDKVAEFEANQPSQ